MSSYKKSALIVVGFLLVILSFCFLMDYFISPGIEVPELNNKIIHDTIYITKPIIDTTDYDVRPGQIWVLENDNPFERVHYEYYVIAVRDGYVKYRSTETGEEASTYVNYFKLGAHLKK